MENNTSSVIPDMFASQPVLIGPFDRYWLLRLVISSPVIKGEASASAIFIPYRVEDDVISSPPIAPVRLEMENLLAASETDPELAQAIVVIAQAVIRMGVAQGLLLPPNAG